ncbi:MAG TPA: ABC transporter permease [Streptosporangiaceae bacterium]|nr:ABC transporter permease [Streptosporangiaceae bacterium]
MTTSRTPAPPIETGRAGAPRPARRGINWQGFRSLSRAMFRGFVRDRAALFFTILFPVLFLLLFGSLYKSSSTPKINVVEVGRVSVLDQARAGSHGQLDQVLTVTHTTSLPHALNEVRQANVDAAVQQQGGKLIVHYSIANPTTAGVVQSVFAGIVQAANQAASGRPPAYQLATQQVEDKSLKPIQYLTPGLLGWAIASGGAFAAALTLVGWRKNKLLRRLRLAPVGTTSIVTARIAVSVAVAIVETFVFIAIATTPYFGLKLTAYWWMAIPVVICGTLAFMSIGLLVGALAKTQEAATALVNLIVLPMAFLGGAFIPLAFAPAWIVKVSYVMPLRYLVVGMQNVMARGDGPASALPAMGILLGFAAVLTVIAVRVFRWDEI